MGFDLQTHFRDKKGQISAVKPYRLHCSRENGWKFERDGQFYSADGKPINYDPVAEATKELEAARKKLEEVKAKTTGTTVAVESKSAAPEAKNPNKVGAKA